MTIKFDLKHLRQLFAAIWCNLIALNFGAAFSWGSIAFEELQKDSTLLPTGVLTLNEASLMVSVMSVGGLIGNVLSPVIGEKYGHKQTILWLGVPQAISWLLIIFAQNVYYLYLSRILLGITAGAIFICGVIFIAEIADHKIRDALNILGTLICSVGMLLGYVLGRYLDYKMQAITLLCMPVIFMCVFIFIPDSPTYLARTNQSKKLENARKFYGTSHDSNEQQKRESAESKLTIHDFFNRAVGKGTILSLFLITIQQFSGLYALVTYTVSVFEETGSSLSVLESSMIIAAVQLLGNIIGFFAIAAAGSKLLFLVSSAGTGIGMLILATYSFYRDNLPETYNWIPIISLSYILLIGSVGLMPIPYIFPVAILPLKVRSILLSAMHSVTWAYGFITAATYPVMSFYFGMHGSLIIFAGICFIGTIGTLIFIPETTGRTYEDIIRSMEK